MPVPDPIAIGNIVQVIIGTRYESQSYLNVLHYICNTLPPDPAYQVALDNLNTTVETDEIDGLIPVLLPCLGPNVQVDYVQSQRVYPTRDYYIREPVQLAGTHLENCDAGNLSAVITKQSDRAGRGRSGSFHVAGIPSTAYASGVITAGYQEVLNPVAIFLGDGLISVGENRVWLPGMFNPQLGTPNNWSNIVQTFIQPTVRVERRRTLGVGQ